MAHTRDSLSGAQGRVGDRAEREAPSLVRTSVRAGACKLQGIEKGHLREKRTGRPSTDSASAGALEFGAEGRGLCGGREACRARW